MMRLIDKEKVSEILRPSIMNTRYESKRMIRAIPGEWPGERRFSDDRTIKISLFLERSDICKSIK